MPRTKAVANSGIASVCLACLLYLIADDAFAADWPQWRGPNRDGSAAGLSLPARWATTLKPVWKVKIGEGVSSPVVVADRIYTHSRQGDDEMVSCIDLAGGKTIWSGRYPAPWKIQPGAGDDRGPHSTPTVTGSWVYTLGINAVLTCWDARTGGIKWRWTPPAGATHVVPQYGASISPLVADGLVFAHGAGEKQTALAAFDAATGEMRWAWHGDLPAYSSPILVEIAGRRQIVFLTERNLVGLAPEDGRLLWKRTLKQRNSYENIITPVRYKELIIYSTTGYSEISAVRLVPDGDTIKTEDVWTNNDHRLSDCTPIIVGDLLIGLSHGKVGHLFCLDAATGKNLWEHGNGLQSEVPLINADGLVLAVTKGIRLTLFRANPDRFDPVVEWQGPVAGITAGPVFLGDRVLLWDSEALKLFRLAE